MCPIVDNSSETVRQLKPDPVVPAKQFTDECEPKLARLSQLDGQNRPSL
jgi:hypothetical protein